MGFSVFLRLTWTDQGRLSCSISDWSGPLDERLLSLVESIASALDKVDTPQGAITVKLINSTIQAMI